MSAYQHIALQPSANDLISTAGEASEGRSAISHRLGTEIPVARLATLCGFAGAVLVQAAIVDLVARLALNLESTMLPTLAVSTFGLALGTLAMIGGKSFNEEARLPG